jgi:hypothetical protein
MIFPALPFRQADAVLLPAELRHSRLAENHSQLEGVETPKPDNTASGTPQDFRLQAHSGRISIQAIQNLNADIPTCLNTRKHLPRPQL